MHYSKLLALAAAIVPALAAPTKSLTERATQCGQFDTQVTGSYTIFTNLWGESSATSGSQCDAVTSLSGNTLAFSTSWTWAGGQGQVKSYTNAGLNMAATQISKITSIPSVARYTYTGSSIIADVAYDLFTSSTTTGSAQFEIMIWLAALGGAGPISSTGSPIASPVIDGVTWNLFSGPNGAMTVYSFVVSNKETTSFSGDLLAFFTYLEANNGFSSSQFLQSIQFGTEPFSGSNAVLSVSAYSVSLTT